MPRTPRRRRYTPRGILRLLALPVAVTAALALAPSAAQASDTSPPAPPTITTPTGTWVPGWPGSGACLDFTPSPDSDVTVYYLTVDQDPGTATVVFPSQKQACLGMNGQVTTEGPHTFTLVAYDAAGNASTPATVSLNVDITPTFPVRDLTVTNPPLTTEVTVAWLPPATGDTPTRYKLVLDYDQEHPVYTTATSYTRTLPALSSTGSPLHHVEVDSLEANHNFSIAAARLIFLIDPTPPIPAKITSTNAGTGWSRVGCLVYTYIPAHDPEAGIASQTAVVDGATVATWASSDPGDVPPARSDNCAGWPVSADAEGVHTLKLLAIHGGTQGYAPVASNTVTYRFDRTAPKPAVLVAPRGRVYAGERTTITWAAPKDALSGIATLKLVAGRTTTTLRASATAAGVTFPAGDTRVVAIAGDAAGNTATSAPVTVHAVKRLTPSAPTITKPATGSRVTRTFTLSWSASIPSYGTHLTGYQVLVDGKRVASTRVSQRSAKVTVRAGTHTITVVARDSAGKTARASVRITAR